MSEACMFHDVSDVVMLRELLLTVTRTRGDPTVNSCLPGAIKRDGFSFITPGK